MHLPRAVLAVVLFATVTAACTSPTYPPPATIGTPAAAPTTTAASATAATASSTATTTEVVGQNNGCKVNPANAPVPTPGPYEWVPAADRIQVSISGVPSGAVQVTGPPVEVDVTLCNNSPVAYPKVAVVFALEHCSCSPNPNGIAKGTVERFDQGSGTWVTMGDIHTGTGMDYLAESTDQQSLPKGKSVTLHYRFSYDPSMTSGTGAVIAEAVIPSGPNSIGQAELTFTVNH